MKIRRAYMIIRSIKLAHKVKVCNIKASYPPDFGGWDTDR